MSCEVYFELLGELKNEEKLTCSLCGVPWDPDRLIVSYKDGEITLWNVETKKIEKRDHFGNVLGEPGSFVKYFVVFIHILNKRRRTILLSTTKGVCVLDYDEWKILQSNVLGEKIDRYFRLLTKISSHDKIHAFNVSSVEGNIMLMEENDDLKLNFVDSEYYNFSLNDVALFDEGKKLLAGGLWFIIFNVSSGLKEIYRFKPNDLAKPIDNFHLFSTFHVFRIGEEFHSVHGGCKIVKWKIEGLADTAEEVRRKKPVLKLLERGEVAGQNKMELLENGKSCLFSNTNNDINIFDLISFKTIQKIDGRSHHSAYSSSICSLAQKSISKGMELGASEEIIYRKHIVSTFACSQGLPKKYPHVFLYRKVTLPRLSSEWMRKMRFFLIWVLLKKSLPTDIFRFCMFPFLDDFF